MDPKLKLYLERLEARINKRFGKVEKKIEDNSSEILALVRDVSSHLSNQIREIDTANSYLRQHVDHIFKRIDYLEKKLLK